MYAIRAWLGLGLTDRRGSSTHSMKDKKVSAFGLRSMIAGAKYRDEFKYKLNWAVVTRS